MSRSNGNGQVKPDYDERFTLRGDSFEDVIRRVAHSSVSKNGHQARDESHRLHQIAETVRERRKSHGWSPAELARYADVGSGTIKSVEEARVLPRPTTVRKLEEALEVSFPA